MITPLSNDHYAAHLDPVLAQVLNRAGDEVDWHKPFTELLPHRLILAPEARSAALGPRELVADALAHTPVPV